MKLRMKLHRVGRGKEWGRESVREEWMDGWRRVVGGKCGVV